MDEIELKGWVDRYGRAWEERDPEAAASLFSADAKYFETPFVTPAQGRDGVREYWTNATRNQSDIAFSYDIVSAIGSQSIVRWWAKFRRLTSNAVVSLDGIFLLRFNREGLCHELREWWHSSESDAASGPADSDPSSHVRLDDSH